MPSDRIILEGMQFYGYHGVNPEERSLGQPFQVDVEAEIDLSVAGTSDNLEDTVNYAHLYRVVREVMNQERKYLLEAVAEEIARRALAAFPLSALRVRVKKTRPPIKGAVLSGAAVEIYRSRDAGPHD